MNHTMGGAISKPDDEKPCVPQTKLEAKMVEATRQRASKGSAIKSFNSLIMKFPKIDATLRKLKTIFEEFDENSNGTIDPQELKHCFNKLEISFTEEEFSDLFKACDVNDDLCMRFNEYIVVLCLVFLIKEGKTSFQAKSRIDVPNLETTFETLLDAFVFLDKNKDGYVSKAEMIQAINETATAECSSGCSTGRIALKRFEEMDWDKNGMVTFKEFLFAFTHWVGIDEMDDEEDE